MDHPLIAKPHEVKAILDGRQYQFRRIVKPGAGYQASWLSQESLNGSPSAEVGLCSSLPIRLGAQFEHPMGGPLTFVYCPFGRVGDKLWVREKYFPMRYDWNELGSSAPILYSDSFIRGREAWGETYEGKVPPVGHAWKGAVTMPRAASRLLLEITEVRVERVQAISEADAVAEGCATDAWDSTAWKHPHAIAPSSAGSNTIAISNYASLWQEINGPKSWAANPWVWVVEFKVVAPTPTPITGNNPKS